MAPTGWSPWPRRPRRRRWTSASATPIVAVVARVAADRGAALMVGAGTNDTRTTIARHEALAEVEGITASLAVVPYYVRPSEAAIVAHFQAVAARSPVPLVLYNIPYRTGSGLGAAALLELAGTDGIVGLKQAVNGLDADTLRLLAGAPSDFAVLCGDDPFILPLMLMGARGAIAASAHLCTERFAALVAAAAAGRVDDAREHAEALLASRARAVRRAQPGGAQGDAARGGADRHARAADAAAGRLGGRPRAR